jgi:hypothetical protein
MREPINSIAIDIGVSAGTMRRLAARWGWKASKDRAARDLTSARDLIELIASANVELCYPANREFSAT